MKTKDKYSLKVTILLVILLGLSLISLTTAMAAPPAQDPLPTITFEPPVSQDPRPPVDEGTGGAEEENGGNGGTPSDTRCASLSGQVINWGVGGIPGVGVELMTGSWQAAAASGSDGNYGFGGLGIGVARLHVSLAPGQDLTPSVQDAGIYLNCDYPIIANIAVYSGDEIEPPVTLTMVAPEVIVPGTEIPIRLTLRNDLPNDITNVVVTDLLPQELLALEVTTSSRSGAETQIIDGGEEGQLAVAFFDSISSGAELNIFITVMVAEGVAPGTSIRNTATLFYRESVAVQDAATLTVQSEPAPAPVQVPATATAAFPTPEAGLPATPEAGAAATPAAVTETTPVSPTVVAQNGEEFVPPDNMPTTGDSFLPPPNMLPVTGEDTLVAPNSLPDTGLSPLLIPVGGLGLAGFAFICHRLRSKSLIRKK